jgi:hypothetical protein
MMNHFQAVNDLLLQQIEKIGKIFIIANLANHQLSSFALDVLVLLRGRGLGDTHGIGPREGFLKALVEGFVELLLVGLGLVRTGFRVVPGTGSGVCHVNLRWL